MLIDAYTLYNAAFIFPNLLDRASCVEGVKEYSIARGVPCYFMSLVDDIQPIKSLIADSPLTLMALPRNIQSKNGVLTLEESTWKAIAEELLRKK